MKARYHVFQKQRASTSCLIKLQSKDRNFWQNFKKLRFELSNFYKPNHCLQLSICQTFLFKMTFGVIFIALSANTLTSQIIGGTASEKAYDMCKGNDNNLYLAGFSSSYGNGNRDFFIARYNTETGNLSYNTWGDCVYNEIRSIIPHGQNIIAAGFSFCRNGKSLQSMVTKVNPQLEFEWVKNFGNWHYQHGYKIVSLYDGNLLTGGIDRSIGLYGPYLILTDNNGNLIWEKTLNDYQPSHVVDMIQKQNGNVLLICSKGGFFNLGTNWHSNSNSDANTLIIEIDLAGNIISDTVILAPHHDIPVKAIKTSDDGFYLLSHTQSYEGNGSFDICTQKFDSDLNIEWTKLYGTTDFEYASDFEIDSEGNIHIIGTSAGFADYPVMYYLKTDALGELIESQGVIEEY